MPVKKSGKKFAVNNKEFGTEQAANDAYKSYVAQAMGANIPTDTKVSKPVKKTAKKKVVKKK